MALVAHRVSSMTACRLDGSLPGSRLPYGDILLDSNHLRRRAAGTPR